MNVAILGAGPSGFYTASKLLTRAHKIDMFERLPVPFGLLRYGVAPDHSDVKVIATKFNSILENNQVAYYGNVCVNPLMLAMHYHAVVVSTGAFDVDNTLANPPGLPASEFVKWYNGFPNSSFNSQFLNNRRIAIIGIGNVAVDVARILLQDPANLEHTDIPSSALAALKQSKVDHIDLIGRRGPLEAAFTTAEMRQLLSQVNFTADKELLDKSFKSLDNTLANRPRRRLLEIMRKHVGVEKSGKSLALHFNSVVHASNNGSLVLVKDGQSVNFACDGLIKAIGTKSNGVRGLAFDATKSMIPNHRGHVMVASLSHRTIYFAVGGSNEDRWE